MLPNNVSIYADEVFHNIFITPLIDSIIWVTHLLVSNIGPVNQETPSVSVHTISQATTTLYWSDLIKGPAGGAANFLFGNIGPVNQETPSVSGHTINQATTTLY